MPSSPTLFLRSRSLLFASTSNARSFTVSHRLPSRLRQPGEPTGPNEPPIHITAPKSKSPLKVWPIVFIFVLGGVLFKKIVDDRKDQGYQPKGPVQGHMPSGKGQIKPSYPH